MKNLKIGTRMLAGFAAVILIVGLLAVFAFITVRNIATAAHAMAGDSIPSLLTVGEIETLESRQMTLALEHI
jgi:hypothetical protein